MSYWHSVELVSVLTVLAYVAYMVRRGQQPLYLICPGELAVSVAFSDATSLAAQSEPAQSASDQVPAVVEDAPQPEAAPEPRPIRFLVDSLTLLTCHRFLFGEFLRQPTVRGWEAHPFRESFVYLSGLRVDDATYVISHLLPVRFSHQGAGGVRVAQNSNIETFASLDDLGLPLLAHAHSHPGHFGPETTHPSATDSAFQARLERGGALAIGLIFSRSRSPSEAYVRFFAGDKSRFSVEVQGNHVEPIDDHLFRLSVDNDHLPLATIIAR